MKNLIFVPELKEIITNQNWTEFFELAEDMHPAELAEVLSPLEPQEIWELIDKLSIEKKSEIFSHLDSSLQVEVTELIGRLKLAELLTEMPSDDRVDLFKKFPVEMQENILPALARVEREDIRRLASYPEGSAGSVMTSEYVSVPDTISVEEAIRRLRLEATKKETIY
ncbi:MAG: hypothetical protein PHY57_15295, partial [Ignavibacterium sp.]|nr:hypothetical protein [Ignavibacterium sp.]